MDAQSAAYGANARILDLEDAVSDKPKAEARGLGRAMIEELSAALCRDAPRQTGGAIAVRST